MCCPKCVTLEAERDEARRERDEALESLGHSREIVNVWSALIDKLEAEASLYAKAAGKPRLHYATSECPKPMYCNCEEES